MAGGFDPRMPAELIVQALMAGGPAMPELTIAVNEAGGLGFLAAGHGRAQDVRKETHAGGGAGGPDMLIAVSRSVARSAQLVVSRGGRAGAVAWGRADELVDA
jgi:Nitronate monooxygenase